MALDHATIYPFSDFLLPVLLPLLGIVLVLLLQVSLLLQLLLLLRLLLLLLLLLLLMLQLLLLLPQLLCLSMHTYNSTLSPSLPSPHLPASLLALLLLVHMCHRATFHLLLLLLLKSSIPPPRPQLSRLLPITPIPRPPAHTHLCNAPQHKTRTEGI